MTPDPRVLSAVPHPDGLLVTPDPAWLARERRRPELAARLARRWRMAYDAAYHAGGAPRAPDFATWTSSLTRAPIPDAAMRTWLDATLARLRAGPHRRVLDLGCGTGLVLAGLAPACDRYLGLDASGEAVAGLSAWVRAQPGLGHVELLHRPAHALDDLPAGGFDLVVLNSVVQYFPELDHLLMVLRAAVRCLAPGGRIWLGDLRTMALLPLHARMVAHARLGPVAAADTLAARLLSAGRELALDPGALPLLAFALPRAPSTRFFLKPSGADPELAGFRFDAALDFDAPPPPPAASLPWRAQSPAALAALAPVALLGVPNARLPEAPPGAVEPEHLAAALSPHGVEAELRPTPGCAAGCFDALLRPAGTAAGWPPASPPDVPGSDPLGAEACEALCASLQAEHGPVQVVAATMAGWRPERK